MSRPRWMLHTQALWWRSLMEVGMTLHRLAPPFPPEPLFCKSIPATVSPRKGNIDLYFYTPGDYQQRSLSGKKYPALINFHGGGFTIGRATDDARWASAVVDGI